MTATATSPLSEVNDRLKTARADRREAEARIKRLIREKERIKRGPRTYDPHAQAGPKNVELMRETFKEGGTMTAAEATAAAGAKPGHQTWAIRALLEEGQIIETGRKVGVSKEYRYLKTKRKTRLGPGE
jgi:Fic family protein